MVCFVLHELTWLQMFLMKMCTGWIFALLGGF